MYKNQEKARFTFRTRQKTLDEITEWSERIGSRNKSEFIEAAIQFYIGYLATQEAGGFMPEFLNDLLKCHLGKFEDRMSNVVFKLAVETGMLFHTFCAKNKISEKEIDQLRDGVVREVRSLNDIVYFKDAYKLQNKNNYEDD